MVTAHPLEPDEDATAVDLVSLMLAATPAARSCCDAAAELALASLLPPDPDDA